MVARLLTVSYSLRRKDLFGKIGVPVCFEEPKEMDETRKGASLHNNIPIIGQNCIRTPWGHFGHFSMELPILYFVKAGYAVICVHQRLLGGTLFGTTTGTRTDTMVQEDMLNWRNHV